CSRRDRRIARHVELDRLDSSARVLAQPRCSGVAFLAIARTDEHVPAIAREHPRDLLPDATVRAGDERRLRHAGVYLQRVTTQRCSRLLLGVSATRILHASLMRQSTLKTHGRRDRAMRAGSAGEDVRAEPAAVRWSQPAGS